MSDGYPIEIRGLRKAYGSFVAVDDLNLNIEKNSFTGFLGPNGAGKSTTLKILTNLTKATGGDVFINGVDVNANPKEALRGTGTVVETPEFYTYLTPAETFRYIGEIIGMSSESIKTQTDEILEEVKMTEWKDNRIGTFSKGMKQRIAIGQALLDNPSVIILDEPTSGLDPRGTAEMRQILKGIRNGKRDLTVLMSSHMLYEVSDLCDRVAMINHGKLLLHDSLEKVMFSSGRKIVLRTVGSIEEAVSKLKGLKNISDVSIQGKEIILNLDGGREDQAQLMKDVVSLDIGIYSLAQSGNTLEDRYLDIIKESR